MKKLYLAISMLVGVVLATYGQTYTPRNNITGYPTFLNNHRDSVGVLRNTGSGVGAYGKARLGELDTAAIRSWLSTLGIGGSADGNNFSTGISFVAQRLTMTRSGLSSIQADIDTGYFARRDWVRKVNDSLASTLNYLRLTDTAAMLSGYQRAGVSGLPAGGTTGQALFKSASGYEWATPVFPPTAIADVTGLSTALGLKVNYTDTAGMLSPYLRSAAAAATYQPIGSYVPGSRTITINGTTFDLSANRSWTISTGVGSVEWGSITGSLSGQTDLQAALDGKQAVGSYAAASHTHTIANVTGLQTALDGKQVAGSYAASSHTHITSDVTGLSTALGLKVNYTDTATMLSGYQRQGLIGLPAGGSTGQTLFKSAGGYEWATQAFPPTAIADVTGLQTALDGKQASGSYASASHTHVTGDVTGLSTALGLKVNYTDTATMLSPYLRSAAAGATYQPIGSYAASSHTHTIANVTGLQTALDGKQATLVSGTTLKTINGENLLGSGNITISGGSGGLPSGGTTGQVLTKSASGEEWATVVFPPTAIADVTGLQAALDSKSAISHTHSIADVTGLQTELDGKANVPSRAEMLVVETDFFNVTSPFAQGLTGTAVSSGTTAMIASEPNHPGILDLRDATTANGGYRIMTDILGFRLAGGEKFVLVFQMRGVRSTAVCRFGFIDATSATVPVDGVYIDIVGNGTTLTASGVTRNNNTQSTTGTTFAPAANTWYAAIIEINSNASTATFTIYNESGVEQWTNTLSTNIPTASGRETGAGVYVGESSTDAAAAIIRLDYLRIASSRTLIR